MSEVKLVLRGAFASTYATRNVFYLTSPGTGNIPTQTGVQTYIASMWSSSVKALLSTGWAAPAVDVATLVGTEWVTQDQYALTGIVGTDNTAQVLPFQVAACLIGRTGLSRVIPKKYIAALTEAYGGSGVLDAGPLATLNAMATAWATPFTDETIEWTPMTQLQLGTFSQILRAHCSPVLATMRSRKQGVGI